MAETASDFDKLASRAKGVTEFGQKMGLSAAVVSESAKKMRDTIKGLWEPVDEVNDAVAALQTVTTSTMGSCSPHTRG